jgi:hypothetical protein
MNRAARTEESQTVVNVRREKLNGPPAPCYDDSDCCYIGQAGRDHGIVRDQDGRVSFLESVQ